MGNHPQRFQKGQSHLGTDSFVYLAAHWLGTGIDLIAAVGKEAQYNLLDLALILDSVPLLKLLVSVPGHLFLLF